MEREKEKDLYQDNTPHPLFLVRHCEEQVFERRGNLMKSKVMRL
jgi:hypothetical protein